MKREVFLALKDYQIETEDWGCITQTEVIGEYDTLAEAKNAVKKSIQDDDEYSPVFGYVLKLEGEKKTFYYELDDD